MARKTSSAGNARNMKPFYTVLAAIAVLGIGAILYARMSGGEMATDLIDMTQVGEGNELVDQAEGVAIGEASAPVQVIVFSDFMCPGCKHWSTVIEPVLKAQFVAAGKVHYTYYDFPLMPGHRFSFLAARATRCAGDQEKFWEYHDMLFARQEQWSYAREMPTDLLLGYGNDIGLDMRAFTSCVRSDLHAQVVTANKKLGDMLGVGGTPTVYVNGRKLTDREWQTVESVTAAIQAAGGA
ncbi:MAG TPA: DsbA family protein [Longimicrobiales bacterium]|nr:DsbA family protein [Longimicrobiales bacterium]